MRFISEILSGRKPLLQTHAYNSLLTEKKEILANVELMRKTLFDTAELAAERDRLQEEMALLVEMTQTCVSENARVAQDQDEYQKRYNALVEKYETAKSRYDEIVYAVEQKEAQSEKMRLFIKTLKEQDGIINGFDKEFDDYEIIEYFDDGVSGTKFRTRTQFQKMFSDAENGLFECLMVKDFSRLGRDYIEVGNLMEFTFPQIGLRFISVNDGYDSINCFGTFGGMDVAFKNLIHHLYSRDLSRKTKSALASKRAGGEYVSGFVTYGCKKDPNNKNNLIIDEEFAKIVKEIFDMALSGMECLEIAQELKRRKVPTFLAVQKSKSNYVAPQFLGKDLWVQGSVHRI